MKNLIVLLSFSLLISSCKKEAETTDTSSLMAGAWRATLDVQDGEELPFIFVVNDDGTLTIHNAEERILVDEIEISGDSIRIQMPVYEGYFSGRFRESNKKITGNFIKPSLDRVVPFEMVYGANQSRFKEWAKGPGIKSITGNWETVFSADAPADRYEAIGIFRQIGINVTGTFRTTTGDYRYLEGTRNGDELRLSTFDGAHAFLFKAKIKGDSIVGNFYSGNHWKEPFVAKRNNTYELPDAKTLTYLKDGYDRFDFSFPDVDGKLISLQDARFKDKVVLVQIMGSWCPNCLEESKFYRDYLLANPNNALEVIALAYEYAKTEDKALESIGRLKDRLELPYPVLLAQYGEAADKQKAAETLPMLNHVLSYPTTIFIDKKGDVRRIHTGFNGKATGEKFLEYKDDFEEFMEQLLAE